jgi:hypothetical protein
MAGVREGREWGAGVCVLVFASAPLASASHLGLPPQEERLGLVEFYFELLLGGLLRKQPVRLVKLRVVPDVEHAARDQLLGLEAGKGGGEWGWVIWWV